MNKSCLICETWRKIVDSRLPKNTGLFCKRALQKRLYSAKETYETWRKIVRLSMGVSNGVAVCHDSFNKRRCTNGVAVAHTTTTARICVPWHIYMCVMTHSCVCLDAFLCVAVGCSVMQCVAVFCRVLQCAAVRYSVFYMRLWRQIIVTISLVWILEWVVSHIIMSRVSYMHQFRLIYGYMCITYVFYMRLWREILLTIPLVQSAAECCSVLQCVAVCCIEGFDGRSSWQSP